MATLYTTGTINLVAGTKAVTGVGTAWATMLIAGGVIYVNGLAVPIDTVNSNTSITLGINWPGASGSFSYAIFIDNDVNQVRANATALATYIARLDNASLTSLAALAATMGADKLAYATGTNTMAWAAITAAGRAVLAGSNGGAIQTAIGISAFAKTLLDDADAAAALISLGGSAVGRALFTSANAAAALATLGVNPAWEKVGPSNGIFSGANVSAIAVTDLGAYKRIKITGSVWPSTEAQVLMLLSKDNAASWDTTSNYMYRLLNFFNTSAGGGLTGTETSFPLSAKGNVGANSLNGVRFNVDFNDFGTAAQRDSGLVHLVLENSGAVVVSVGAFRHMAAEAHNAFMIYPASGTISGTILVEGSKT